MAPFYVLPKAGSPRVLSIIYLFRRSKLLAAGIQRVEKSIMHFIDEVTSLKGTASILIADPWMYLPCGLNWVGLSVLLGYFLLEK